MSVHVVILAAGQGSRMKSKLPKVLHPLAGKPMLHHVIDCVDSLAIDRIHVVVGHGAEIVKSSIINKRIEWVYQAEQAGTGHAVAQALPSIPDDAKVLVVYGDIPLIKASTLENLLRHVSQKSIALLTVNMDNPMGYGRIVRDASGFVTQIVEQKDATAEQITINEVNTGILAVSANLLKNWLPKLSNNNAQGEYYLTDIIEMSVNEGLEVAVAHPENVQEVQGVNNRMQMAELERWYQLMQAESLMEQGVSVADPSRLDIRGTVQVAQDVILDINVVLDGSVVLGTGVKVGANCIIKNSIIAANSIIEPYSIIEEGVIGANCTVGPFARVRPGTQLADNAKLGNFVETKKAIIGSGSKVNHLSYIGDAEIGLNVNVGAGTITCNYDGVNKFKTQIADNVFVGSNTSLVAPVKVGKGATIGAGSTITKDIYEAELAVARSRQKNINNWERPVKKS